MILRERKRNRLAGFNYSRAGWYFVTICSQEKGNIFGAVVKGKMKLNDLGMIADKFYKKIGEINHNIFLDEYIIMPDHVHGIIEIVGAGHCPARTNENGQEIWQHCPACTVAADKYGKLSKIVNGYKNMVTKEIRNKLGYKDFRWHRSFYDVIIKNEQMLHRIRNYIIGNPRSFLKAKKR